MNICHAVAGCGKVGSCPHPQGAMSKARYERLRRRLYRYGKRLHRGVLAADLTIL